MKDRPNLTSHRWRRKHLHQSLVDDWGLEDLAKDLEPKGRLTDDAPSRASETWQAELGGQTDGK